MKNCISHYHKKTQSTQMNVWQHKCIVTMKSGQHKRQYHIKEQH